MTTQDRVLELGCGQGFFVKEILKVSTPQIEGIDIGQELLDIAKKNNQQAVFTRASASDLSHIKDQSIDIVYSVLALQNMSDLDIVMKEVKRILKTDGKLIAVLNHPAFRVPKQSDWYFSPDRKIQGRVVYTYMSDQKFSIDMHPGRTASGAKKEETFSFHHPLQYYVKLFNKYNFGVSRLEEWISHKTSEEGPKKRAEDQARKEIPLFMALEIKAFLA